jgi:hypothetical protein
MYTFLNVKEDVLIDMRTLTRLLKLKSLLLVSQHDGLALKEAFLSFITGYVNAWISMTRATTGTKTIQLILTFSHPDLLTCINLMI